MGPIAVKGGDLLHVGNQVLIERAQNAGPGQVNLNPTRIFELGNYKSLATIFDIPDLTFSVESLDASAALEALLCGVDYSAMSDGDQLDLTTAQPLDVASQFKPGKLAADPFAIAASVAIPYLNLESLSYRFGLTDQAAQTASLRGDSIFYNPGSVYQESTAGTNAANQVVTLANPALPYEGDLTDGVKYALGVKVRDASGVRRLRIGNDYSEQVSGGGILAPVVGNTPTVTNTDGGSFGATGPYFYVVTAINANGETNKSNEVTATVTASTDSVTLTWAAVTGATGYKVYRGTATGAENKLIATLGAVSTYKDVGTAGTTATPPSLNSTDDGPATLTITVFDAVATNGFIDVIYASPTVAEFDQSVHTVPSATRPAAIRGRDITVFVNGEQVTNRWTSVQAVTADWKVNLERDEEFGNYHLVNQDYTAPPDVTGTIQIKPRDPAELYQKVREAAGVQQDQVAGANASPPVELLIKLSSPVDGSILKCLYVPDARINVPGFQGQVNQKLNVTLNWQSDSGALFIIKGDKV